VKYWDIYFLISSWFSFPLPSFRSRPLRSQWHVESHQNNNPALQTLTFVFRLAQEYPSFAVLVVFGGNTTRSRWRLLKHLPAIRRSSGNSILNVEKSKFFLLLSVKIKEISAFWEMIGRSGQSRTRLIWRLRSFPTLTTVNTWHLMPRLRWSHRT
jgi:hypothetical protein